jgi:hypothetical protein
VPKPIGGRLPTPTRVLEWEAFGGYLLRTAADLHLTVPEVLREVGVVSRGPHVLEALSVVTSPDMRRRSQDAFGIDELQVENMTVARFARGALVDLRARSSNLRVTPVCVRCVRRGRWDVRWFTGLMVVCDFHRCALQVSCQRCAAIISIDTVFPGNSWEGRRFAHATGDEPCPIVERRTTLPVEQVHANAVAVRLLAGPQDNETTAALVDATRTLMALRHPDGSPSLAKLASLVDGLQGRHVQAAALVARGNVTDAAVHPDIVAFVTNVRRGRISTVPARPLLAEPDALQVAVKRASAQLRWAPRDGVDVPEPGYTGDLNLLPAVVPVELFNPELADHFIDVRYDIARTIAAIAMAQTPGGHSWRNVARPLRVSDLTTRIAREMVEDIIGRGRGDAFWSTIFDTRECIVACRIDFAARVDRILTLNPRERDRIADLAGGLDVSALNLTRWLLDRWAGVSPTFAPTNALRTGRGYTDVFAELDDALNGSAAWRANLDEILYGASDASHVRYA